MPPPIRVLIQARTDSSRLPGKALLPIAGMPSAVLALKRAANTGLDVRLATSERPLDDQLADTATSAGIPVFRGSAHDVRSRFLDACADLDDRAIVIRLTADNLLPDGALIETVVTELTERDVEYLNLDMMWRKPPYGLSVEAFRIGALRDSARESDSDFEREHVTPTLRTRHEASATPAEKFQPQESVIRCTMDTFDDYLLLGDCFREIDDPIHIDWKSLLARLVSHPDAPMAFTPGPGLVLGTAQIAMPYGSAVTVQPPAVEEAVAMVRTAITNHVTGLDTARAYAGSERVMGRALKDGYSGRCEIISKLSPLDELAEDTPPAQAAAHAEISVLRTLDALGGNIRPHLLLHRAAHLRQWDGAVWERLTELRQEGLIGSIGVSVQSPEELELALDTAGIERIQMPCNLLDWRWREAGLTERLEQAEHITVHVRSVLLQGTLARPASSWPNIQGLEVKPIIEFLQQQTKKHERHSIADLCIAWMRAQPWVDALVIGAERIEQLRDTLNLFTHPPLEPAQAQALAKAAPKVPEQLLDPAQWKK